MAFEIERKFLIEYPDTETLEKFSDAKKIEMVQTYLISENGTTSRVRKRISDGEVKYIFTEKLRINDLKCIENEREVTADEYEELLKSADPERKTVYKTRYCLPFEERVVEVDIYPFWNDRAIAEVEMESEDEIVRLPEIIKVIRDVTSEKAYKNASIAKHIPDNC